MNLLAYPLLLKIIIDKLANNFWSSIYEKFMSQLASYSCKKNWLLRYLLNASINELLIRSSVWAVKATFSY